MNEMKITIELTYEELMNIRRGLDARIDHLADVGKEYKAELELLEKIEDKRAELIRAEYNAIENTVEQD